MGRRGPPPKPTALKLLGGNAGKRALNKEEPAPERGAPRAPAGLTGVGRSLWLELAPMLEKMGVLTVADGRALEAVCRVYAEYVAADKLVQKKGLTYDALTTAGDVVPRANPAVAMRSDAARRYLTLIKEFGLTPASRAGVKVVEKNEKDALSEFLNRGKNGL